MSSGFLEGQKLYYGYALCKPGYCRYVIYYFRHSMFQLFPVGMDVLQQGKAHNLIGATHKRALCANILTKTGQKSIHASDWSIKSLHNINPEFMWETFCPKATTNNLRSGSVVDIHSFKGTAGVNSFLFRATLAWNHLPAETKKATDLNEFKAGVRCLSIYCQCKLCKFLWAGCLF